MVQILVVHWGYEKIVTDIHFNMSGQRELHVLIYHRLTELKSTSHYLKTGRFRDVLPN